MQTCALLSHFIQYKLELRNVLFFRNALNKKRAKRSIYSSAVIMRVLDVLRQLYLLLWKNVILRRRQKIRLAVEIIWPLFLFLVLVWVRLSTNLKTFQSSCHFPQRPLPSAGLIPFAQGLICHLDYFTCYNKPLSNFYDDNQNFTQLATSVLNLFEFINEPNLANQILPNLTVIASSILNQRYLASMATQRFTLSQILTNEQVVNSVYSSLLNTTPNFNLLYSNLSQPLNLQYNALTSLLLGPYLDVTVRLFLFNNLFIYNFYFL